MAEAVVIGAGPGGLATAYELQRRGIDTLVVDRAPAVASTWRNGYDSLRLNTVRSLSHLPGKRLPRRLGRWVARDELVSYLDGYAARNGLRIQLGTEVTRIDRVGAGWALETSSGRIEAGAVVVATGECNTPRLPPWPGRESFTGELVHSADYRNPAPFAGRDVLVVGTGNSGAEIAIELANSGAASVRLSMRTPPQVVPRTVAGVPTVYLAVLTRRLPGVTDRVVRALQRVFIDDLEPYGLPRSQALVSRQFAQDRVVPIFTLGSLVKALEERRIEIVGPVEGLEGPRVLLGTGATIEPDVVVAATGYDCGLDALVGHLGVLGEDGLPLAHGGESHPDAPGLHFTGFTNPITGNLRELRLDARRIGRALAATTDRRRAWDTSRHPQQSAGQAGAEPSRATAAP